MSDIDVMYQISKLKETEYNNILAVTSLIELLIEKNIITKSELAAHSRKLDQYAVSSQEE